MPIFVCTLALPFAPCPLHIFEPRYRLMLRRAIETGANRFGMCMYSERTSYSFTEYGCILDIRNYQFSRDGRAVVATVGERRFKVLHVSSKDGYNVAKVEWVVDKRVHDQQEKGHHRLFQFNSIFKKKRFLLHVISFKTKELQILHDEVYQLSLKWYSLIPMLQKRRILEIYGISEMPEPDVDIQLNGKYLTPSADYNKK